MKKQVLVLALIVGFLNACGSSKSTPTITPAEAVAKPEPKKELTPELAEGKSLFEGSCARCHQLYKPSAYTAEAWKPIVTRMQKKARLNDEQGMKIYNYLTAGVE